MSADCSHTSRSKHWPQAGEVPAGLELTPLGRRLLRLEPWEEGEE